MEATGNDLKTSPNHKNQGETETKPLDNCVICLEPVSERAVAVPCNHVAFDFICLASWASEHAKCPLCNASLTAIEYDWRAPDDYKTFHIPKPDASKVTSTSTPNPRTTQLPRSRFRQRGQNRRFARTHIPFGPSPTRDIAAEQQAAIQRRRHVYRAKQYSLHVGSNRISQFRDFTPQTFAASEELQQRAKKWIRRELQVFEFLSPTDDGSPTLSQVSNAEFLLFYIISILKTVDLKGSSGKAQEILSEFLGQDNARLFLHELNAWLRSPYMSLEDWDRHVQYQDAASAIK